MNLPIIECSKNPIIEPKVGCSWADTMVLNPAIWKDSDKIHMLFRATGPYPEKNLKGKSDPYPIFLGYAVSNDNGKTFEPDFSKPCLSPKLAYKLDEMYIEDINGNKVVNYANGCVEDPRVFEIEGKLYLTVACRMFPPGPYWLGDKRRDNVPDWVFTDENPFGTAASENETTTVLFKMDTDKLISGDYENAFKYVCVLTDGKVSDNRDVFLFPNKMKIDGKMQYVMLHRPHDPEKFQEDIQANKPSVFLASAENLSDFITPKATNKLLIAPTFDWEEERVGASFPPIDLGNGEWLISYHGKQLPDYGYTQSFMIIKEVENDFPKLVHRCKERLLYATQKWELPDLFPCPCIFTTGGVVVDDKLIMSYGAADQKIGIATTKFSTLIDFVKKYDENGNLIEV